MKAGDVTAGLNILGAVREVDALHRLVDVEFSGLAVFQAVEVVNAKGGVAGGLDLGGEDAGAQGVDGAAGEEEALAVFDGDGFEVLLAGAFFDGALKGLAG